MLGVRIPIHEFGDTVQPLTPKQRKRNEPAPLPTSAVPPYSPSGPTDTPSSPTSDLQAEPRLRPFTSSNPVGICRSRTKPLAAAVQATVTPAPGRGRFLATTGQPTPPPPRPPPPRPATHTLIRGSPSSLSSWFSSYSVLVHLCLLAFLLPTACWSSLSSGSWWLDPQLERSHSCRARPAPPTCWSASGQDPLSRTRAWFWTPVRALRGRPHGHAPSTPWLSRGTVSRDRQREA